MSVPAGEQPDQEGLCYRVAVLAVADGGVDGAVGRSCLRYREAGIVRDEGECRVNGPNGSGGEGK